MKKLKFYVLFCLCALAVSAFNVSCSSDDDSEEPLHAPSYRDGNYSGQRLTVTLDGHKIETVESADVESRQIKGSMVIDSTNVDSIAYRFSATYDTNVTLHGFPTAKETTVLKTQIFDYTTFKGTITVGTKTYDYAGEFDGSLLSRVENQSLAIVFTTK